jgi:hypothetical protein
MERESMVAAESQMLDCGDYRLPMGMETWHRAWAGQMQDSMGRSSVEHGHHHPHLRMPQDLHMPQFPNPCLGRQADSASLGSTRHRLRWGRLLFSALLRDAPASSTALHGAFTLHLPSPLLESSCLHPRRWDKPCRRRCSHHPCVPQAPVSPTIVRTHLGSGARSGGRGWKIPRTALLTSGTTAPCRRQSLHFQLLSTTR